MITKHLTPVLLAAASTGFVAAPVRGADAPVQVMLVATYHFSNPGQDLNNVKVDDVLTPKRQAEVEAVTSALAAFKPTRVAVEWPAGLVDERYPKYLAGTLPESRNEVVQLGFRLARTIGSKEVSGLDVDGDFPFEDVQKWAKEHGRGGVIDDLLVMGKAETDRLGKLQDTATVGGVLRDLNQPASIALNHSFYPPLLAMGAGDAQPGARLVSAWNARNLGICAKLLQAAKPGDRMVVFFGQGHIHLLAQCVSEQPDFQLVDPLAYLPATDAALPPLHHVACVDVPPGQPRPGFGCFNIATVPDLRFSTPQVYWHLRNYGSVEAANAARSASGAVNVEDGKVWLSEFGAKDAAPKGGVPVAVIGPMNLPPGPSYTAVLSYAVMRPGDRSRVHTHAGPEAWFVIAGEQCLEVPAGKIEVKAGHGSAVDSDIPMLLVTSGNTIRRALALVIHDSARPRGTNSSWKPTGACP